ncbi:MAG: zinc-ribbon domain-containing protein [Candidatus Verstraetearchaeota archaeon]|nr:zinc-ribbon domain-containing protein [Candidatus Verstraetearchaeota archaeon]
MYEEETILKQESGVKSYDSPSPPTVGFKAGAFADLGTLILTNKRLVFVSKGSAARSLAWAVNPLAALSIEKKVSSANLDELANEKESFSIPLSEITNSEAARKLGMAYVRVDHPRIGQKGAHSFIFGAGWSKNEDWVAAINAAKMGTHQTQSCVPSSFRPPPSPQPPTPPQTQRTQLFSSAQSTQPQFDQVSVKRFCSNCGSPVSPNARFCSSCGNKL